MRMSVFDLRKEPKGKRFDMLEFQIVGMDKVEQKSWNTGDVDKFNNPIMKNWLEQRIKIKDVNGKQMSGKIYKGFAELAHQGTWVRLLNCEVDRYDTTIEGRPITVTALKCWNGIEPAPAAATPAPGQPAAQPAQTVGQNAPLAAPGTAPKAPMASEAPAPAPAPEQPKAEEPAPAPVDSMARMNALRHATAIMTTFVEKSATIESIVDTVEMTKKIAGNLTLWINGQDIPYGVEPEKETEVSPEDEGDGIEPAEGTGDITF